MFGAIVLTTGPLWARGAWGVWWKWEPRLTSMALLILIFASYWVLRVYGGRGEGIQEILRISRSPGDTKYLFRENGCQEMAGDHPDNMISRSDPDMKFTLYFSFLCC